MASKEFYNEKDVPKFQEEICKKKCVMNGKCIEDQQENHWFTMCPHYHRWKLGYTSFVWDQIEWNREHSEEAELKHKELVAKAKAWGDEQRRLKKEAKAKEKESKKKEK